MKFSIKNSKPAPTSFTEDQTKAYNSLIDFINSDFDEKDYKRALVGPAGTGKTYLIRSLIKNCNLSYSVIGLAAPTHKACRVLQESLGDVSCKLNTIASDLGLRINYNNEKFDINHPPFDPRGEIKIKTFKLYIVDESSMLNRSLTGLLEKTCKTESCKIIYVGDETQLAPVGEFYSPALRGIKTYRLNQIVRQEEDNPIRDLLDLLRFDVAHKTFNFINYITKNPYRFDDYNTKGYAVCNQEDFTRLVYTNFTDERLTNDVDYAKIVAYTNINVSAWNKFVRNAIIKDAAKSVITQHDLFISYITIVNMFKVPILKNSEDYIIKEVVNYVHPKYGFKGFLCRFICIHGGSETTPIFVLDHTDNFSVQKYLQVLDNLIKDAKTANTKVRSVKWKEYFEFKESCLLLVDIKDRLGNSVANRSIDYGFALTSHKSQGSTFDTVFVDVNDIVFDSNGRVWNNVEEINRRLYVACSRCKNKLYLRYGK